ncbi:uncharacterized protein LOC106972475 [Acinonyx jubatus]|uniref:Uncharacterized protein LOC106972475 n=1 Tax=Acinonyx jubatus TaxID=32536 RepID=A0A6I9ZR95_ACIJB|nr:uncharacterized protein LOC106972475 [Acinonyx jubatus]
MEKDNLKWQRPGPLGSQKLTRTFILLSSTPATAPGDSHSAGLPRISQAPNRRQRTHLNSVSSTCGGKIEVEWGASEGPATKRLVKRSLVVFRGLYHVTTKAAALGDVAAVFEKSSLVQAPLPAMEKHRTSVTPRWCASRRQSVTWDHWRQSEKLTVSLNERWRPNHLSTWFLTASDDQRYQGISLPRHFHATRSPPLDGNPACEPMTVTFWDWTPVLFCTSHRWPKIKPRGQQRRVEVPGSMLRHFNSTWPEHGYACQETTMVLRLQQISPLGENLQLPVTSS